MNKKRFVSLFLVFMMVLSLFPTAAFAGTTTVQPGVTVDASFDGELQTGISDQTAMLTIDGGDTAMSAFMAELDFTSLVNYISVSDVEIDGPDNTIVTANRHDTSIDFDIFTTENVTGTIATVTFAVDAAIPSGYYNVPVNITEWNDVDNSYFVKDESVEVIATLTVLDEHGNIPGAKEETS